MEYGLPYKGSKNKLAERIVRLLPKRTHLVDLFCGGCAVSHAALLMGKYEHIHINDINWMCPTLFIDALNGKYNDENRWISREDFFRLKDTDPYVAVVWSFGNNLHTYLYSKEIEPLKKAIHYAMFFSDYSLGKELGHDLSFIDPIQDLQKRYLAVKHYFNRLGHFQQQSFERVGQNQLNTKLQNWGGTKRLIQMGGQKPDIQTWRHGVQQPLLGSSQSSAIKATATSRDVVQKKNHRTSRARRADRTGCIACNTESGSTVCPDIRGGQILPITSSVLDYEEVAIPEDSVIYCDIPYEGTGGYLEKDKGGFDYERFYQWCERQTQPVFISSYQMPEERFDCIEEFTHRSTLSATANNLVTERIYVPKHQSERGNRIVQLTLF